MSTVSMKGLRQVLNGLDRPFRETRKAGLKAAGQPPVLVHIHVPKTAGSSLNRVLRRNFKPDEILVVDPDTLDRLRDMDAAARHRLRAVMGHLTHGVADLLPQPSVYLCLLRPPEERLLSYYRFIMRRERHPLHKECTDAGLSFGEFLLYAKTKPGLHADLDNGQVRRISGRPATGAREGVAEKFERALRHVFAPDMLYGLTSHFDDFLVRMKEKRLIPDAAPERDNVSPTGADLEEEKRKLTSVQVKLLEEYTFWDRRFYDRCSKAYFHEYGRLGQAR